MTRWLSIYWSVILMGGTVVLACLFDPTEKTRLVLSWDGARTTRMLVSPYLWICVAFLATGIAYARRQWSRGEPLSDGDRMATIWFLANACWYHTGCDIASGLFQVMPNLTDAYAASNGAHLMPMHHPERIYLDAVYWLELFVQLPLCVAVYFLYLRRSTIRPIVEVFLCALHLAGTVAYYLPNLLLGESTHPVLSNLDRAIASLWIIVPIALSVRVALPLMERRATRAAVPA